MELREVAWKPRVMLLQGDKVKEEGLRNVQNVYIQSHGLSETCGLPLLDLLF